MTTKASHQAPTPEVTLVIPGRNAGSTLRACLSAVAPLLDRDGLVEIIFVDDASTDDTREIVADYPVRVLRGFGRGPGAARNIGWRAASTELVWFIDADCVAEPNALQLLLRQINHENVAAVGGSYGNLRGDSLVACLIHDEIIQRHIGMAKQVTALSSFNVLYRREVLLEVGGFDEQMVNGRGSAGAEDLELAYRVTAAGYRLRFEPASRVGHFHPTSLKNYLRVQCRHGYWRVPLYVRHSKRASGDSYSGLIDHIQPPLAMLTIASLPLLLTSWWTLVPAFVVCLLIAQLPMTMRLALRIRKISCLTYVPFGFLRAFYRGFGMSFAVGRLIVSPRGVLARNPRTIVPVTSSTANRLSPAEYAEEC